ncbi:MAG: hypothetical protein ACYS8W_20300, partial [Planctomycetota bacterium]
MTGATETDGTNITSQEKGAGGKRAAIICAAVLAVVSFSVCAHTLAYGFLEWDDMDHIVQDANSHWRSFSGAAQVFAPSVTADYQPLRY